MRKSVLGIFIPLIAALLTCAALPLVSFAQGGGQTARPPSKPTPKWPDGRVNFGPPTGEKGYWNAIGAIGGDGGTTQSGGVGPGTVSLSEVPFQPWARALQLYRQSNLEKDDPHPHCKPPGGVRQFQTPFGWEIIDQPETKRLFILSGGAGHSYRTIYMDGRKHPPLDDLNPTYFGHSVGHWEGETLVIDTIGFNERFWFMRAGLPHTRFLHLIERFSRPDFDTLRYEAIIDDPGAYTKTWSGWTTGRWAANEEIEEYFCMDNNKDVEHLIGQ